jgi:hypothetical protein
MNPARVRSKTNLSITSPKKSFSVYGSSSQLSSTSAGPLEGNKSHKLGEVPAYLKKAQARMAAKETKPLAGPVVTEHQKSHQLGQRPAYLNKRVKSATKGIDSEIKTKKELFGIQKKQLDTCQVWS